MTTAIALGPFIVGKITCSRSLNITTKHAWKMLQLRFQFEKDPIWTRLVQIWISLSTSTKW